MVVMRTISYLLTLCIIFCWAPTSLAGEATVATAANFFVAAQRITETFQSGSGHKITLVRSSTGKLASQIAFGAPFDVLLAADQERPRRLIKTGHAVAGSRFTYAIGRIALWSGDAKTQDSLIATDVLKQGQFRRLSIANPDVAPYGAASWQVLKNLGLAETHKSRLIYGENVQQAYAFAASGNTDLAIVALSFMLGAHGADRGAYAAIAADLHDPILQDAVLLKRAENNPAAISFLDFMKTQAALKIMQDLGYSGGPQ